MDSFRNCALSACASSKYGFVCTVFPLNKFSFIELLPLSEEI